MKPIKRIGLLSEAVAQRYPADQQAQNLYRDVTMVQQETNMVSLSKLGRELLLLMSATNRVRPVYYENCVVESIEQLEDDKFLIRFPSISDEEIRTEGLTVGEFLKLSACFEVS